MIRDITVERIKSLNIMGVQLRAPPWKPPYITAQSYWGIEGGILIKTPSCRETPVTHRVKKKIRQFWSFRIFGYKKKNTPCWTAGWFARQSDLLFWGLFLRSFRFLFLLLDSGSSSGGAAGRGLAAGGPSPAAEPRSEGSLLLRMERKCLGTNPS